MSTATVSHAFNRPERISEATRELVLRAAAELNYSGPNPVGRQLRRGKAEALGMVFADELGFPFEDPAAARFMAGLSAACSGAELNLLLIPSGPPQPGAVIGSVDRAAVDGFVVYSVPDDDPHLTSILRRRLATVVVDSPVNLPSVDWVGSHDDAGGRDLAEYLVGLGHRCIGVICSRLSTSRYDGPADEARWRAGRYAVAVQRITGINSVVTAARPGTELPVEERFDNTVEAGADALRALLRRRPDVTAVCCLSDIMAFGAMAAANELGLSVPADLTITGYDDVPEAGRVGLTTVQQPLFEKGRVAGELFLSQSPDQDARRRFLETRLQVRATSAAPARTKGSRTPSR